MIIRQRDIREKERQIADLKRRIDECNIFGVTTGPDATQYEELSNNLVKANLELKQMKGRYAEYEAMFSR